MSITKETRAYFLLFAAALSFGVNWPIVKLGLAFISPLWFASARIAVASACVFALVFAQGRLRWPGREDIPVLVSVGVFQIGANIAFVHLGLNLIEAGRSVMLAYTTPLWVTPLAAVFLKEHLSVLRLVGVALGVFGVAVLFEPGSFDPTDGKALAGNGMMILSAVVVASVIIHIRSRGGIRQSIELLPWQMAIGGVLMTGVSAVVEGPISPMWSASFVVVLVYCGVVATAFSFWAFVAAMRDLPAISTAVGSLLTPIIGVLSSSLLLNEPLTAAKSIGLFLIACGVLIVSLADLRKRRG